MWRKTTVSQKENAHAHNPQQYKMILLSKIKKIYELIHILYNGTTVAKTVQNKINLGQFISAYLSFWSKLI